MSETISDLLPEFLDHLEVERRLKLTTIRSYQIDLQQIAASTDDKPLSEVTAADFRQFIRELSQDGLKARTIRRKLHAASTFYKFQIAMGRVQVNIAQQAQAFAPTRRYSVQKRVMNTEQWKTFAETPADSVRDSVAWGLLAWLGIRNVELRKIRVKHVEVEKRRILIAASGACGGGAKGDNERYLPIPDSIIPGIEALAWNRKPCDYLLRGTAGGFWSKDSFRAHFKAHLERCDLPDEITPHWLRHTVASSLADELSIFELRDFLGHVSTRTVEGYVKTSSKRRNAIMSNHPLIS